MTTRNEAESNREGMSVFGQAPGGALEISAGGSPLRSAAQRNGIVYLVLDCSSSMLGNKLAWAKQGVKEFGHTAYARGHRVGLICFHSNAEHICEPQDNPDRLSVFLERLGAGGSTNMAAAIQLATQLLQNRDGRQSMVIVTDGIPNSKQDALAAATEAKAKGIDIITLGTEDADHAFLRLLASRDDLATVTRSAQLAQGIQSLAKMLPETIGR